MPPPTIPCPVCDATLPASVLVCVSCKTRIDSWALTAGRFKKTRDQLDRAVAQSSMPIFVSHGDRPLDNFVQAQGEITPMQLYSHRFAVSNESPYCHLYRCRVLVFRGALNVPLQALFPLFKGAAKSKETLVVFAEQIAGDLARTFIANHEKGSVRSALLTAGTDCEDFDFDRLAELSGTHVVDESTPLESVPYASLGKLAELWASPNECFVPIENGPHTALVLEIGGVTAEDVKARFRLAVDRLLQAGRLS